MTTSPSEIHEGMPLEDVAALVCTTLDRHAERIRLFAERETPAGVLRLLRPTECVMDRLAWSFHDADMQCLEQAIRVASLPAVDLPRIERWARGEGPHGAERLRELERRLRQSAD